MKKGKDAVSQKSCKKKDPKHDGDNSSDGLADHSENDHHEENHDESRSKRKKGKSKRKKVKKWWKKTMVEKRRVEKMAGKRWTGPCGRSRRSAARLATTHARRSTNFRNTLEWVNFHLPEPEGVAIGEGPLLTAPVLVQLMAEVVYHKRWRLSDLFRLAEKDRTWRLNPEKVRKMCNTLSESFFLCGFSLQFF